VPHHVAEAHAVMASQVNKAGKQSLLRRAVSVKITDQVHYGQIIAIKVIRTQSRRMGISSMQR
jgi:hypothetical protein